MPRKFVNYSRQHQKLLYSGIIKCYSAFLQSKDPGNITDSNYWTYRAKEELKQLYTQATKEISEKEPLEAFKSNLIDTLELIVPKDISIESKVEIIWNDIDYNLRKFVEELAIQLGNQETFSLALRLLSKEKAIAFTQYCIDYFLDNEIPIDDRLKEMIKETEGAKYTIACIRNKKCVITGKVAEIHHVEAFISRKYQPDYEKDLLVLPVCREVHNYFHSKGNKTMIDRYILTPVPHKLAEGTFTPEEITREIRDTRTQKLTAISKAVSYESKIYRNSRNDNN